MTERTSTTDESGSETANDSPLLELDGLEKWFDQTSLRDELFGNDKEQIQAVDGVDLALQTNEAQGVIGESGCGKTTLLLTLAGLHEPTGGEIRFRGKPTSEYTAKDWKEYRSKVQVIFQDPFNSLDPKFTVRETLLEPLQIHGIDRRDERIREKLRQVELNPPEKYIDRLPKHLSGGEKQRVSIARALMVDPDVILADELDVAMFYISHDISTVAHVCQSVNVMYLGRIVESSPTKELLNDPKHPYTQELIQAVPVPNPHVKRERTSLSGAPPDPKNIGEGCRFRDRCPDRMEICETTPAFVDHDGTGDRSVSCHLYYDHEAYVIDERGGPVGGATATDPSGRNSEIGDESHE